MSPNPIPEGEERTVFCRICEEEVPVNQRGLIKRHESDDPEFYCDGSLKPAVWGLTEKPS